MTDTSHVDRLLIDGELRPAADGATYDNIGPTTGTVIGTAPDGGPADIEAAIVAARTAFDATTWSTDVELRVRCLRQLHRALLDHVPEWTAITMAELGAPASACASVQVVAPIEFASYYADLAESYAWTENLGSRDTIGGPAERWVERVPVGVVAAISPWNVPNQINLAKVLPALAAGCTVVLKPAPETPWTALHLARVIAEHTDIPPGVVNIVTSSDKAIGELLTTDPRVDMISFTGSTAVGRRVMEAASTHLTKVFLELGGKSVSLALDDLEDFSMLAASAAFGTAMVCGQGCASDHPDPAPPVALRRGRRGHRRHDGDDHPGDPADDATMMGPLISEAQRQRVHGYVQNALAEGARLVCGGSPYDHPDHPGGFFYPMTLLADVTNDMTVAQRRGLRPRPRGDRLRRRRRGRRHRERLHLRAVGCGVLGLATTMRCGVARRIRTGTMSINGGVWYGPDVPFGGFKQSGLGREMGRAGLEEYLETTAFARPAPAADDRSAYQRGLDKITEVYAGNVVAMPEGTMAFYDVMMKSLFAEVWDRDVMTIRDRRLLIMGVIAAAGQTDTFVIQATAALSRGELTPDELRECLVMLAPYAGYPNVAGLLMPVETAIAEFERDTNRGDQP